MFLHFCEMLFLELVSGDFLGEAGFLGFHTYMFNELQFFTCNFFLLLFGGKRDHLMFC